MCLTVDCQATAAHWRTSQQRPSRINVTGFCACSACQRIFTLLISIDSTKAERAKCPELGHLKLVILWFGANDCLLPEQDHDKQGVGGELLQAAIIQLTWKDSGQLSSSSPACVALCSCSLALWAN